MDVLASLVPLGDLPFAARAFIAAMVVLNVGAVVAWAVCLCREARAPPPARVRVRKAEHDQ